MIAPVKPKEIVAGIGYGFYHSKNHLFFSYLVIPIGLIIIFAILYGLNQLLTKVIKITFPCSVLGMLINLVLLCVLNVIAEKKLKSSLMQKFSSTASFILNNYLRLIRPLMNFTLKWINVFFIPSFIILPLSDHITFIECLKIAGVFVFGFLLLLCVDVYMILGLQWVLSRFGFLRQHEVMEDLRDVDEGLELDTILSGQASHGPHHGRDDITTIEIVNDDKVIGRAVADVTVNSNNPFEHELPSQPELVYLRDGGRSTQITPVISTAVSNSNSQNSSNRSSILSLSSPVALGAVGASENTQKITIFITNYIDWMVYFTLFIVSLPLYYISSIHTFLPYHLGVTILSYYLALLIPQRFPQLKKIAHPILILTAEILFVFFIGSLIYHHGKPKGFIEDLKYYKTGKNYLNLFNNQVLAQSGKLSGLSSLPQDDLTGTPEWPGCGDVLSSLMDVSIVSLLLPMFTHRKDFIRNFWVLMPPLLVSIALTFFCYPQFCYHIGISPSRSIGFIGRSVTLALGTPLINALDGSVSLMACCTILSGICGVLVGDLLFKLLRVPKNDYVTRGVSLGINCGAIATAHLLNVDPRAALMSSLSFSVFGTIMVIMASIGSVKELINHWVGL